MRRQVAAAKAKKDLLKRPAAAKAKAKTKAEASDKDSEKSDGDKSSDEQPVPPKRVKGKKVPRAKKRDIVLWNADPIVAKLMKKKAKVARPAFSYKPVSHYGGKIYFAKAKRALRVYLRSPADKVEKHVHIIDDNKRGKAEAMTYACALIENDPRAVEG